MCLVRSALVVSVLFLGGCAVELQHDLPEGSANDAVMLLVEHGIAATKARQGRTWTVLVPAGTQARAWRIVRDTGLDQAQAAQELDLLSSPEQRRKALALSTARRLEHSLMLLEGVERARVHLILAQTPKVQIPGVTAPSARASVLLRVRAHSPEYEQWTRALLVGAVENLAPKDVTVIAVEQRKAEQSEVELVPLGPVVVAADSAPTLKGAIVTLIVCVVGLAGVVCALVLGRRRRSRS